MDNLLTIEGHRQKTCLSTSACAQRSFRSACAFAQSDQNFSGRILDRQDAPSLHTDNNDSDQTVRMRSPADLSLRCVHMADGTFSHMAA